MLGRVVTSVWISECKIVVPLLQAFAAVARVLQGYLGLSHLADGIITSGGEVCHFDCQLWSVQAEAGSLAGKDMSICSSANALLVLVHAAVKQKPGRARMAFEQDPTVTHVAIASAGLL